MAGAHMRQVGITISIPEKAKMTLDRQAAERGYSSSLWAGRVFDLGFAAICAREKSMPITDADLDAIVAGTLLLTSTKDWDTAEIAQALGVPEATVARILSVWWDYRRGQA